ncbi:unnamed protein product [Stenotrophomonas maltophilia]|nr:unnamed protein product [Stenotrophomonas maltophilia]
MVSAERAESKGHITHRCRSRQTSGGRDNPCRALHAVAANPSPAATPPALRQTRNRIDHGPKATDYQL